MFRDIRFSFGASLVEIIAALVGSAVILALVYLNLWYYRTKKSSPAQKADDYIVW